MRTLTTTTWLNDDLDWPHVGQVFRLERERRTGGQKTIEVVYGITSLSRDEADAGRLLDFNRAHWGIENGLHYTRDETLREDRCQVRKGNAQRVLASLRNVAVYLLRGMGGSSAAAVTRELSAHPRKALDLLHAPSSTSE
ncbi:Mobile element protein [Fimbriiglobus ruber]|uniref:Mobile element protein n=1 Tax=Fimbriiglobus ruber TaxID=1908690 RepID=A0A225DJL3_9BACT|nr:Mobile element protein [Fimbriiglobus ruber]